MATTALMSPTYNLVNPGASNSNSMEIEGTAGRGGSEFEFDKGRRSYPLGTCLVERVFPGVPSQPKPRPARGHHSLLPTEAIYLPRDAVLWW
ncbi:hypothetical protein E2562_005048 [Oryza meyeriana var. granulata]|uniref:Uncharacterized protein n=1 Tax=Oryza meyeriana var. granulata TaxID=110450 RepID=A0A6G1BT56_9ORYZ|nr:hypothetical protein E2562_005048 [Oryza meyeriana var. granulata]